MFTPDVLEGFNIYQDDVLIGTASAFPPYEYEVFDLAAELMNFV